jgi:hypothetical protein
MKPAPCRGLFHAQKERARRPASRCPDQPPAYCELEVPVSGFLVESSVVPDEVDWLVSVDCEVDELGLVIVDCWSALAPLVTLCEPLPTFTPGLMFAPAFTAELSMPTFASTPTFGFTLVLVELDDVPDWSEGEAPLVLPEVADWSAVEDWSEDVDPLVPLVEPEPALVD